ncbi:MAG: DNA polymerase/3'-5' exonuclease PolX [Candidatus Thorarchaeota archaeon]
MTKNAQVARVIKEIGLLFEIEGANSFKVAAYSRGVRAITSLGEDIESIAKRDALTDIPGIGKGLSEVIKSYLTTGKVQLLEELRTRVPIEVLELDAVPGLGPKKIKVMYEKLGVTDLQSLEKAAKSGQIAELPGFSNKSQGQILDGIQVVRAGMERTLLADVIVIAEEMVAKLHKLPEVKQITIAGSTRRRRETIGDLDILVDATNSEPIMDAFVNFDGVATIFAHGPTKSSVRLETGLQIDLRVIPGESFGAGLQYFTGSVDHNVRLRAIAQKKNMRLNEYGLLKKKKSVAGEDEEGIYETLGLQWVPPELRENQGEIEAAQNGDLPNLIKIENVRGDLHSHTDQSDGKNTIEEMLDAAQAKRYKYYCVSDHTQSLTIANGMDESRLLKQIDEIDDLNASGRWKMKILKGAEVDILAKGGLDIVDEVLSQLDVVTGSIHSRMKDSKKVMTERVCHALENKYIHILGHPTGRLIGKRSEFEIDLEQVFDVAKDHGTIMELNAHPQRLDLNAGNLRAATKVGLKIAINTDAHKIAELDNMRFGIYQARRGWLTSNDVINTYTLKKLLRVLSK